MTQFPFSKTVVLLWIFFIPSLDWNGYLYRCIKIISMTRFSETIFPLSIIFFLHSVLYQMERSYVMFVRHSKDALVSLLIVFNITMSFNPNRNIFLFVMYKWH